MDVGFATVCWSAPWYPMGAIGSQLHSLCEVGEGGAAPLARTGEVRRQRNVAPVSGMLTAESNVTRRSGRRSKHLIRAPPPADRRARVPATWWIMSFRSSGAARMRQATCSGRAKERQRQKTGLNEAHRNLDMDGAGKAVPGPVRVYGSPPSSVSSSRNAHLSSGIQKELFLMFFWHCLRLLLLHTSNA